MEGVMDGVLYERARADRAEQKLDRLLEGLEGLGWPCRLEDLPAFVKSQNQEIMRLRTLLRVGGIEEE